MKGLQAEPPAPGARNWWVPVASIDDLAPGRPVTCALLGQPLVAWHDGREARVYADRCPHRGARLSLGCVQRDELVCPYHEWRFAGEGHCSHIPDIEPGRSTGEWRVTSWPVRQAHGLLWVHSGSGTTAPTGGPPSLPKAVPIRQVLCGPRHFGVSALRLVDAFLGSHNFRRAGAQRDARALSPYSALVWAVGNGQRMRTACAVWACPDASERCRAWFTVYCADDSRTLDELRADQLRLVDSVRPQIDALQPRRLMPGERHDVGPSARYRRWLLELGAVDDAC